MSAFILMIAVPEKYREGCWNPGDGEPNSGPPTKQFMFLNV